MRTPQSQATPPAALWASVLAFQASPGRHAVALREPRLLFDNILPVLQLAANRPPTTPGDPGPPDTVRQAARFFVRHALLRASNDHYALMGVPAGTDAATLREHYRLLIRLTHPDFSQEADSWPADAAARVNRAYEVLTSAVERREYDTRRNNTRAPAIAHRPPRPAPRPAAATPAAAAWLAPYRRVAVYGPALLVMAAAGALALLGGVADDTSLRLNADKRPPLAGAPATPAPAGVPEAGTAEVPEAGTALAAPPGAPPLLQVPAGPASDAPAQQNAAALSAALQPPPKGQAPALALKGAVTRAPEPRHTPEAPPVAAPVAALPAWRPPPAEAPTAAVAVAGPTPPAPAADPAGPPGAPALAALPPLPDTAAPAPRADSATAMQQLRPMLIDLLHTLETGQSERVRQWAASRTRDEAAAARFASVYRSTLNGGQVTGLGAARFDLHQTPDRQVVQGSVQIKLQDERQPPRWAHFRLRAQFVNHESGPQLARLDAE